MKGILSSFFVICFLLLPHADAEAMTRQELNDKIHALSFIFGQETAVDLILRLYPEGRNDILSAESAFRRSPPGIGAEALKKEMASLLGEEYDHLQKNLSPMIRNMIMSGDHSCAALVETLHLRARGKDMPERVKKELLLANPAYRDDPAAEMNDGWTQTFSMKACAPSLGATFLLSFPASWSRQDDPTNNVIQKFTSRADRGPVYCRISAARVPFPVTPAEEEAFLHDSDNFAGSGKYTLIRHDTLHLQNRTVAMIVYDYSLRHKDLSIVIRALEFIFFDGNCMCKVTFNLKPTPGFGFKPEDLEKTCAPICLHIMKTLTTP